MINSLARRIALSFFLVAFQPIAGFSQAAPSAGPSRDPERLALFPFGTKGFSAEEAIRLKQNFAAGLAESKRFDIMTDMEFKNSLEQAGRTKLDSCKTPPCLAQLGKVLNVEKVVQVQAERWEQRFILHIRLVRSSDAALLYDERVDYAGDINTLSTVVVTEQGRKLAAAFLDKEPNWVLIGAALLVGLGLIFWLFKALGSLKSSIPQGKQPIGPTQ